MGTLVKLRLVNAKGAVRNLFSKPLSAVITVLIIGMYGAMFLPFLSHRDDPLISGAAAYNVIVAFLGVALALDFMVLMQSKKSLFFAGDAHYLYTGPFSKKKVLGVYAIDTVGSALLYGLLSLLPLLYSTAAGSVSIGFVLTVFISCVCIHYCIFLLNGILYVRELTKEKKSNASLLLLGGLIAVALGVVIGIFAQNNFDTRQVLANGAQNPLINFVPFFGWARMAMVGVLEHNVLLTLAGFALLALGAALLTAALVNTKGDFYERSMADAEKFTDYYQKMRSGKYSGSETVHTASVRFKKREGAILSKNLLLALKDRSLFRMQDILIIGFYLGMAYFVGMGYIAFVAMLMVWMFMMSNNSSMIEDLQHHYVYLIPGKPFRKLLNTMVVPLCKNGIVLLLSLVAGGLLLKADVLHIAIALGVCFSLLVVFATGNVLSLRFMKSRSNKMVEQVLRMLFTVLAALPGIPVYFIAQYAWGGLSALMAGVIFAGFNLVFSLVVLLLCSPMMKGNELNAD